MTDSQDIAWNDEDKFVNLLTILRAAELFGGEIVQPSLVFDGETAEELDELAETLDRQDMTIARFGKDETAFDFYDSHYGVSRKGVIDVTEEPEPSGHAWTSAHTIQGTKSIRHATVHSLCGKPLTECNNISACKHWVTDVYYTTEDDIRSEYHDGGFSMSDRPSENFWLLPGLRTTEHIDVTNARWTKWNKACPTCFILTPKSDESCQNCNAILV